MLAPIILFAYSQATGWMSISGFTSVIVLLLFGIAAGVRNCYLILKTAYSEKGEKKHGR